MTHKIFSPLKIGKHTIQNRIIMAPLTRMRCPQGTPSELNAEYYSQRACAGLIISEATQISPQGKGYPATPGIHSAEQVQGWKLVTDAVHKQNGKIFAQLWHVGRISHHSLQPNGQMPVAPSAIAAKNSGTFDSNYKPVPIQVPRALETSEIPAIIDDYKKATRNALEAGFDGIEIHSANGYLLDQFLQDGSNQRTDTYGGSIENRSRLLFEVIDVVTAIFGADSVGVRLSPYGTFNDMSDTNPLELFSHIIKQIQDLAYIHLIEPRSSNAGGKDVINSDAPIVSEVFKNISKVPVISAGGYNLDTAKEVIDSNLVDAVAFGRFFIANPDLVDRFLANIPLNNYDRKTFYGGGEKGYTDYPYATK